MERSVIKLLITEFMLWVEFFIKFIPGRTGQLTRRFYYGLLFNKSDVLKIGTGCKFISPKSMNFEGVTLINDNCYFNAEGGSISVGNWTAFNSGVHINASCGGSISIGAHCPIGPGVVMRTANHKYAHAELNIQDQGHIVADIIIEDDCWIGANAVILSGVHIGRGAVIGAGSIVTKNIPSMAVDVGIPAKIIKYRKVGGND
jgi:acetyltransferase-like isoleucine patch superfamily enzyme